MSLSKKKSRDSPLFFISCTLPDVRDVRVGVVSLNYCLQVEEEEEEEVVVAEVVGAVVEGEMRGRRLGRNGTYCH